MWKTDRGFHPEPDAGLEAWVEDHLLKIHQGKAVHIASVNRRSPTIRNPLLLVSHLGMVQNWLTFA